LHDVLYEPEMAELVTLARDAFKRNVLLNSPRMVVRLPDEEGHPRERYFVHTLVPTHDSAGKTDGLVIYADDVTEARAREAQERLESLRLMVEHAQQVALGLYDGQTRKLLHASPRYLDILERAYGYNRDDIISRTFEDVAFIANREESLKLFNSVLEEGASLRLPEVRLTFIMDDRETVWDYSINPIPIENGQGKMKVRYMVVSAFE